MRMCECAMGSKNKVGMASCNSTVSGGLSYEGGNDIFLKKAGQRKKIHRHKQAVSKCLEGSLKSGCRANTCTR